jgi:hypothetical protein
MIWGVVFAFFGLGIVPPFNGDALIPWGNGVYGSTLIGFSATLLLAGRHAFHTRDSKLMKILLYGVLIWLAVEALFSLYYHVWPNVAVDVGIALIFSYTLLKAAAILKTQN